MIEDFPLDEALDKALGHAELATKLAIAALAEAERDGASEDELLQLCNEVISRRLRYYAHWESAGGQPSMALRRQLLRDAALVHTPDAMTRSPAAQ
ncbi:MAG: hypothetical protein ACRDV3_16925 [Acidothermaceae bacterium]